MLDNILVDTKECHHILLRGDVLRKNKNFHWYLVAKQNHHQPTTMVVVLVVAVLFSHST